MNLIFPHQLFKNTPLLKYNETVYLIEEYLYFKQYKFHKQKIVFHRASMKFYQHFLKELGFKVVYIEATSELSDIRRLLEHLNNINVRTINYIETTDFLLEKRIQNYSKKYSIETNILSSPMFLNDKKDLIDFFKKDKVKFNQSTFYSNQRKKRAILMIDKSKPIGGKWTFDHENRKKYPSKKTPPSIQYPDPDEYYKEANTYVETHFKNHLGTVLEYPLYPMNFKTTQDWLVHFFKTRFLEFGDYEDAIVKGNSILNHSILSPMLNTGLITPKEVIKSALLFAEENRIPINSVEGFVRQIIGWREFVRGIYITKGSFERTHNFWGFTKKIPYTFYNGNTGIEPIDDIIKTILNTGYCHHIERLMVLGNFMLLCEFDPNEVYQWFMEMFVDSYDWVMVPNIYGMSQFADGGLFATKPYISGSNYIIKMSNYKKGEWQKVWDGLFWRFMHKHRTFFKSNPRLSMLINIYDKMKFETKENHLKNAELFLEELNN